MPIVNLFAKLLLAGMFLWSGAINKPANFAAVTGILKGKGVPMPGIALDPADNVHDAMRVFDQYGADFLAVVNGEGEVVGTLSEKFIHRRYGDELEKAQREMFGE